MVGKCCLKKNQTCVHCLEKLYGMNEPQNLEREEDAVSLSRCSILMLYRFYPKLMQMVKKGVNGFGATIISVVQQLFL